MISKPGLESAIEEMRIETRNTSLRSVLGGKLCGSARMMYRLSGGIFPGLFVDEIDLDNRQFSQCVIRCPPGGIDQGGR